MSPGKSYRICNIPGLRFFCVCASFCLMNRRLNEYQIGISIFFNAEMNQYFFDPDCNSQVQKPIP